MIEDYPPFPGFRDEAFDFLRQLAANNERDWFKPRKSTYDDELVFPMRCLLAEAAREAMSRNINLTSDPKKGIFRIYRDTRFSKNKAPYKTTCGAVLSPDGSTKSKGGFYIHLQPDNCFLGAGFWHPPNDVLRLWRSYMASHPEEFLKMYHALRAKDLDIDPDEKLKRMPRGYEEHADSEVADFLKFKSFTTGRSFTNEQFQDRSLIDHVTTMMEDVNPLLEFGWKVTS